MKGEVFNMGDKRPKSQEKKKKKAEKNPVVPKTQLPLAGKPQKLS